MRFPTGETYTASTAIPANLAIGNGAPLLIGSNGTLPGDDQATAGTAEVVNASG